MRLLQQRRSIRTAWAPSRLRRLVRRRAFRWLAVTGCILWASALVAAEREAALAERLAWGDAEAVVQVIDFVPAGSALATAVEVVHRPRVMIPDGAVRDLPTRGYAAVDLVAGEILLKDRLRTTSERGLPRGTVAITVTINGVAALVDDGDTVDLWVTDAANLSSHRVASAVLVLHRDERDLTVAVGDDEIAELTAASLRPLTVALLR